MRRRRAANPEAAGPELGCFTEGTADCQGHAAEAVAPASGGECDIPCQRQAAEHTRQQQRGEAAGAVSAPKLAAAWAPVRWLPGFSRAAPSAAPDGSAAAGATWLPALGSVEATTVAATLLGAAAGGAVVGPWGVTAGGAAPHWPPEADVCVICGLDKGFATQLLRWCGIQSLRDGACTGAKSGALIVAAGASVCGATELPCTFLLTGP